MPNWCTTLIELKGNSESIMKLLSSISSGSNIIDGPSQTSGDASTSDSKYRAIDFNKIIKQPDYLYQGDISKNEEEIYGRANTWWTWCIDNWGTKWNARNSIAGFCNKEGVNTYVITFDTAWACPTKVIGRMALLHKDIDFAVCWWEEGGQFDWFEIIGADRRVTKEAWNTPSFDDIMDYISDATMETEQIYVIPKKEE